MNHPLKVLSYTLNPHLDPSWRTGIFFEFQIPSVQRGPGPTLQHLSHWPLCVQHAETGDPPEEHGEMRRDGTHPDPRLQVRHTVVDFFLGHQSVSHGGKTPWAWVSTVCLLKSARGREPTGSGRGALSWRYSVENFSVSIGCCVQM